MKRAAAGDVAFAPGRRVTIRSIDEILTTLDSDGTSGGLVFMPEMARYCGETLEVLDRVDMTCVESGGLRGFRGEEDVYLLRDVRCDGAEHDGCQKACLIFWKRSWLTDAEQAHMARPSGGELKPGRLRVRTDDGRYFCQSSNLLQATHVLSRVQKLQLGLNQLRTGKASVGSLLRALGLALRVKANHLLRPRRRRSTGRKPIAPLQLERGDCVKTNTLEKINETLDAKGCNRGLAFTRYMRSDCGKSLVVRSPLRRIILETTGEMRHIKNTVLLEDSICHGASVYGICPRRQFHFWREDWLTPSQPRSTSSAGRDMAAPAE